MSQFLSYAGVALTLSPPELEKRLAELHPQDLFHGWSGWNFDGWDLKSLPTPILPEAPKFRIGTLTWPTGAVRPAWFHEVISSKRLTTLQSALGSVNGPAGLTMFDNRAGKTITAQMYMLPPLPLGQLGDDLKDSWLLTFTDVRFYWQWRRGTITTPTSWSSLLTQLAGILGITLTPDTIDTAYQSPSGKWAGFRRPTATVLDAVATQIGHKVVANLDGTFKTVKWETASAASDSFFNNNTARAVSGGFVSATAVGRYVPTSVNVSFADSSSGSVVLEPHVVNTTLPSLAILEYLGSTGIPGVAGESFADYVYDGTNSTLVNAYALAASRDWYGWRLQDLSVVMIGIQPYQPTGWEDIIEWTLQKRDGSPFASTFLIREEWDDFVSGDWLAGQQISAPTDSCGVGCGWIAGMATGWCMSGTVLGSYGECADIQGMNSSGFHLRYDGGSNKWVSQVWSEAATGWINKNFIYDTGSGPLRAWLDTTAGDQPSIAASINNIDLVRDCCGPYTANFSFGNHLSVMCTGTVPSSCSPNTTQIKITCTCCSIAGWTQAAYYCIVNADETCGVDTPVCAYLDAVTGRCDTDIKICSVPYATPAECQAACNPDPPTTIHVDCNGGGDVPLVIPITVMSTSGPGTPLPPCSAWNAFMFDATWVSGKTWQGTFLNPNTGTPATVEIKFDADCTANNPPFCASIQFRGDLGSCSSPTQNFVPTFGPFASITTFTSFCCSSSITFALG